MKKYYDNLDNKIKEYFNILEPNFPNWLNDYINTKEMLKQKYVSLSCGTIYSNLFKSTFFYSNLNHSIAVALIVWHFTHDKKQTLAGLFHDISTACFKHCIDFLNGDYMNQESIEDLTTEVIKNSKEIMALLKRDKIDISLVDNYHIYPIADNDSPNLAADRLECFLSNGLLTYELIDIDKVKEIYNDLEIQKNEYNQIELGFKTKKIARELVKYNNMLSIIYREDKTRYSMQFIADIIKLLNKDNLIKISDLYNLKESEVIEIILNSKYKDVFNKWLKAKKVNVSKTEPKGVYYVHHPAKIRYINPLYKCVRISSACKIAKKMIDKNLAYDMSNYVYLDFSLE